MAVKNMIKVGDKVTFGHAGDEKQSGTVVKTNPKTARIKARGGMFDVTYNLIQLPRGLKTLKRARAVSKAAGGGLRGRKATGTGHSRRGSPANTGGYRMRTKKNPAKKKATGRKICAVPVGGPRTKKKPAGYKKATPKRLTDNQLKKYTPAQRVRYKKAFAYYATIEKQGFERAGYAARMAKAELKRS